MSTLKGKSVEVLGSPRECGSVNARWLGLILSSSWQSLVRAKHTTPNSLRVSHLVSPQQPIKSREHGTSAVSDIS
ncbi:unnamed protein product [Pieris brassicae]|uniref:Uncharacterized protein n=1 Tax=Pieris brassicae TaxID=7116 RepID=A0A9P0TGF9_PIEBR|nr:unnamed protein product [Pieris brassicae]